MKRVFTNGCFDILHVGHVRLLQWAASLGDILIVGVNSDRSFRSIKGRDPIVPELDRIEMIKAVKGVVAVEMFDQDTPLELIKGIQPEILVKGPEYIDKRVVGAEFSGEVCYPHWDKEHSTTNVVAKIKAMIEKGEL